MCFTETHLDGLVLDNQLNIPGYSFFFRNDRNAHGGGVIIYFSDKLKAIRKPEFEPVSTECIWAEVQCHNRNIMIGLFYRPPNSRNDFYRHLEWSLESVCDYSSEIVIFGDFNIDLTYPNSQLETIFHNYNLFNVILEPTRVTPTSATLLDPIFFSNTIKCLESGVFEVDSAVSDHKATYLIMSFSYNCKSTYVRHVWNYRRADFALF